MYAFDARSAARGAAPAHHRQRAGRGVPHRRRRAHARRRRCGCRRSRAGRAEEILGVNDRAQLAEAGEVLRDRRNDRLHAGRRHDRRPRHHVDRRRRRRRARRRCSSPTRSCSAPPRSPPAPWSGRDVTLVDTEVGAGARVRDATCELAVIGPEATVGPYTYLRPGTDPGPRLEGRRLRRDEERRSSGEGSKVPHLSYVGDAEIGERHQHRRGHRLRQLRRRSTSTAR